jgi:hypothetical protein
MHSFQFKFILEPDGGSRRNGKFLSLDEMLDEWGKLFEKRLPHPKYLRLRYICKSTTAFPYQNHGGRVCQRFVWPAFFRAFPKGRVLIVELEDNWFHAIWQGQPGDAKNKDPNGRFI